MNNESQTTVNANPNPENTQKTTALEATPALWPGGFGIYKYSKKAVMFNIGTVVTLIVVQAGWNTIDTLKPDMTLFAALIWALISAFIGLIFSVATTIVYLAGVKEDKLSFSDAINGTIKYLPRYLFASILTAIAAILSFFALVIPFFFIVPRLIFVPFLIIDKDLKVIEAFKSSWAMSKGHVGKIYGIGFVNLAYVLLMLTIIGIPVSIYLLIMYGASTAVLYKFIDKNESSSTPKTTQTTSTLRSPAGIAPTAN